MKFSSVVGCFCLGLFVSASACASVVTFENVGAGDYRLDSVTGLIVGGLTYNVDFVHGGSYNVLEASLSPQSPITFNETQAREAALNIAQAVNDQSQGTGGATSLPFQIRVPYATNATDVFFGLQTRTLDSPLTFSTFAITEGGSGGSSGLGTNYSATVDVREWAIFTAIPEPSSFLMFVSGLSVLGLRRRICK